MHCRKCNSTSLHAGLYKFNCHRCEIIHGKTYDFEGVCPHCKLNDFFMLIYTSIDCYQCNSTVYHHSIDYLNYCDSLLKHHTWAKKYPIDLEELCKEVFKPLRVMYQYLIDPDYVE